MQISSAPPRRLSSPPPAPKEQEPLSREDVLALSSSLASIGEKLKAGESLKVQVNGQNVIQVVKDGPNFWTGVKSATKDIFTAGAAAVAEDPSLAFRQAVEVGKRYFIGSHHPEVTGQILRGLVPATRAVCLGIDIVKAKKTLSDPKAEMALKIVDTAHVVTSAAGMVGSLQHIFPSLAAIPGMSTLSVAAVVGDITAFGVHSLKYMQNFTADGPQEQPPSPPSVTVTLPPEKR